MHFFFHPLKGCEKKSRVNKAYKNFICSKSIYVGASFSTKPEFSFIKLS